MNKQAAQLVVFSTLVPGLIFRGYAMSVLWAWFVTRFEIREIGVAEAIGLCVLLYLVLPNRPERINAAQTDDERLDAMGRYLGGAFFTPILALMIGWAVKSFI